LSIELPGGDVKRVNRFRAALKSLYPEQLVNRKTLIRVSGMDSAIPDSGPWFSSEKKFAGLKAPFLLQKSFFSFSDSHAFNRANVLDIQL
jgi:hypothetical protein